MSDGPVDHARTALEAMSWENNLPDGLIEMLWPHTRGWLETLERAYPENVGAFILAVKGDPARIDALVNALMQREIVRRRGLK